MKILNTIMRIRLPKLTGKIFVYTGISLIVLLLLTSAIIGTFNLYTFESTKLKIVENPSSSQYAYKLVNKNSGFDAVMFANRKTNSKGYSISDKGGVTLSMGYKNSEQLTVDSEQKDTNVNVLGTNNTNTDNSPPALPAGRQPTVHSSLPITSTGRNGEAIITYKDIEPGVDLKYTTTKGQVKEEIIINTREAIEQTSEQGTVNSEQAKTNQEKGNSSQSTVYSSLSYSFTMNIEGLTYTKNPDGTVIPTFTSIRDKETTYSIPPAFMIDSKGAKSYGVTTTITEDETNPNTLIITLTPDIKWLLSTERQFPIIIDPTLVKGDAPVLSMNFDEGYGQTTSDGSGNSNTGTLGATSGAESSDPTWKTEDQCISGKCMSFDGSDDRVSFVNSSSLNITGAITISLWIYPRNLTTGWDGILFKRNLAGGQVDYGLVVEDTGNDMCFNITGGDDNHCSTGKDLVVGEWQFVTATFDEANDQLKLYKDGVEVLSTTDAGTIASNNLPVHIGTSGDGEYIDAMIDEVRVYSYVRSSTQIKQDYIARGGRMGVSAQFGSSNFEEKLSDGMVAHYKMDETSWTNDCSTSTVTDSTTFGNNGKSCPASTGSTGGGTGRYAKAGVFDGIDDVVTVSTSSSISPQDKITVAGWVKTDNDFPASTDHTEGIVDKGDYKFYLDKADGKAKWVVNDAVADAMKALKESGSGLNGDIKAMVVYNNELYIGGAFVNAGDDPDADYIAKWDGNSFSWPDGGSLNANVEALYVWNGALYIGGSFTNAGGDTDADGMAKWDGGHFNWPAGQSLGTSPIVYAIEDWNGNLYFGGNFTNAGGDADADYIGMFNGSTISWPTGKALTNYVYALDSNTSYLYIGGNFVNAPGDTDADYLTTWDGSVYDWPTGQSLSSYVSDLKFWNGELYVGGNFSNAGADAEADYIAKWDGAAFSWPSVTPLSLRVVSLHVWNNELYLGGYFSNAGGDADADGIAKWDGVAFSWPTGQALSTSYAFSITDWNGNLYIGGSLIDAGGDTDADFIGMWNGSAFSWPTYNGLTDSVYALTSFNGDLYIGGYFTNAGGDPDADGIVKWDGSTLSWPTGQGLNGNVYSSYVWNGALYIGGNFTNAGGDADADYIAKWDGSSFSWPTGQGLGAGTVDTMIVWNGNLYIGGNFSNAGGDADADMIAMWNGSAFSWPTGQSLSGLVYGFAVWKDDLYVAGNIVDAGGDQYADNLAKWNGSAFSAVGGATQQIGIVYDMAVWRGNLYLAGFFNNAGGDADADSIAMWDGSSYTWPTGQDLYTSTVRALVVWNDKLYVGGNMLNAGGDADADNIAVWDGSTFSWPVGSTPDTYVRALSEYDGKLIVGGVFVAPCKYICVFGSDNVTSVSSTKSSWTANTWNHFAGVYDGTRLQMYINGNLENSLNTNLAQIEQQSADLYIGSLKGTNWFEGGPGALDGNLDDIRIYNKALNAAEIRTLAGRSPEPILYYPLDEGTGTSSVNDASGNDFAGTISGSMTESDWTSGKFGKALDFDGADDRISAGSPSGMDDLGAFSVSAWIYPRSAGEVSEGIIMGKEGGGDSGGWLMAIAGGQQQLRFLVARDTTDYIIHTNADTIVYNTWQHVAVSWDGTYTAAGTKMYINGVEQPHSFDQLGSGNRDADASNNFVVGNDNGGGQSFDGVIDDVKVYNYTRTSSQIIEDMNGGHPVGGSPVGSQVGYWKFDEGYGDTAYDSSPQAINGDMSGSTTCPSGTICPTWNNAGKFGKAMYFGGLQTANGDSHIRLPDNSYDTLSEGAISIWFKPDDAGDTNQTLFAAAEDDNGSYSDAIEVIFDTANNNINLLITDNASTVLDVDTAAISNPTNWHHLVISVDSSGNSIYIDGVKQAGTYSTGSSTTNSWFEEISENTTAYTIGCDDADGSDANDCADDTYLYQGLIDEFKIYSVALTPDEVKTEYLHGKSNVMGAVSTASDGKTPSWNTDRSYCVPGDTTSCGAPVAEWKFDDGSGTTAQDSSGGGRVATLTDTGGADTWIRGREGKAFRTGGDNQDNFLSFTSLDLGLSNTIEFWVNYQETGDAVIIGNTSGIYGTYITGNGVSDQIYYSPTSGNNVNVVHGGITLNSWTHFTIVRSGTSVTFYKNGAQIGTTQTLSANAALTVKCLTNHCDGGGGTFPLFGAIDNVRLFDYARTPAQIAWDYNKGAPVAHYKFDECSGVSIGDWAPGPNRNSLMGNNGTLTIGGGGTNDSAGTCAGDSSEAWHNGVNGQINYSMSFDGTDDYVEFSENGPTKPTNAISFSSWVKLDNITSWAKIISKPYYNVGWSSPYVSYALSASYSSNGTPYMDIAIGGTQRQVIADTVLSTGQWYHISGTFDGNTLSIYINGKLDKTSSYSGSVDYNGLSNNVAIGSRGTYSNGEYLDGQIDDVRIYDYALTPAQIKTVYNNGAVTFK